MQSHTVLLIAAQKSCEAIGSLLDGRFAGDCALSGADARQKLLTRSSYDLAVIKAPLVDEFGDRLAERIAEQGIAVIFLIGNEHLDDCALRLSEQGVLCVGLPMSRQQFAQAVNLAVFSFARLAKLRHENEKLSAGLVQAEKVGRAKCLLVQYEGMNEAEAHRTIEKRAMDLRISRADVAGMIIAAYADPSENF